MPLSTILTILAILIAAVPLGAVAYVFWKSSVAKQSATNWQDEAERQQMRADRLESTVADLTKQVNSLTEQVNAQAAAIQSLTELSTGRAKVEALADTVHLNHAETMSLLHEIADKRSA